MRVVLQRVVSGSVRVEGEIVGQINKGLVCLVGIGRDDSEEDAEFCCRRLLNARLWPNENGAAWKTSVASNGYEVLLISQFTLHGYFAGNKPDFHLASTLRYGATQRITWLLSPGPAKELFDSFCNRVRRHHSADKVAEGVFGAMMEVALVNDGPVTMNIDSKDRKGGGK